MGAFRERGLTVRRSVSTEICVLRIKSRHSARSRLNIPVCERIALRLVVGVVADLAVLLLVVGALVSDRELSGMFRKVEDRTGTSGEEMKRETGKY